MPRLFTGLQIPEDIAFVLSLKRGGLSGARWIDPENYHVTLRYIGDIDHRMAHEVYDALEMHADVEPFDLTISLISSNKNIKNRMDLFHDRFRNQWR